jgi:ABC-type multidrug transport system ATPase subunit
MSAVVSAEPLWQIEGVQLRHGRRAWPAEPLRLAVPSGRVAVLGLSGAGKSTLLNLLAGFQLPERGTIRGPAKPAWVPQDHGLWLKHSVLDHLRLAGATADEARQLLTDFDLQDRAPFRAEVLSIGEGARLAVARALAQKAPVLVMDEPLAHVDSARAAKYWGAIRARVAATGASLVFATHQPERALAEAEHAICLRDGAVIFQGKIATLYAQPHTDELAGSLGPANWLTAEDALRWFGETWPAPRCIRPERLVITPAGEGAEVISSRFLGSHAETELRHPSGGTRLFLHRPASGLPIGARVCVKEAQLA